MQEAHSGASQTARLIKSPPGGTALPGASAGDSSGGQTAAKGEDAAAPKKTGRGNASTLPQPIFLRKSSRRSVLAEPDRSADFSRYPDLRLTSTIRPSQISPMAGFRPVWCLHAYSGGTVRDFHPIPYPPGRLHGGPGTETTIYFHHYHTTKSAHCQG